MPPASLTFSVTASIAVSKFAHVENSPLAASGALLNVKS